MHAAALLMRDAYADISDAELLSEAPLLGSMPAQLLQRLSQKALVGLALDGEPITDRDDPKLFVLLQGSARVEAGGQCGRLLRAGDVGGELAVLGLDGLGNASVRSRGSSLYLAVSPCALAEAAQECGEEVQQKLQRLAEELRGGEETAAAFRALCRGLGLPADLGDQLLSSCEEVAVLPPGRVLSAGQRKELLAFVLTGQVQVGAGAGEAALRGPGSALALEALQGLPGQGAAAAPRRAAGRPERADHGAAGVRRRLPRAGRRGWAATAHGAGAAGGPGGGPGAPCGEEAPHEGPRRGHSGLLDSAQAGPEDHDVDAP